MKRIPAIATLLVIAMTVVGCATMSSMMGWTTLIDGG